MAAKAWSQTRPPSSLQIKVKHCPFQIDWSVNPLQKKKKIHSWASMLQNSVLANELTQPLVIQTKKNVNSPFPDKSEHFVLGR